MNPEVALSIVNEARARGVTAISPDSEDELIAEAEAIIEDARNALHNGMKGETIVTLLSIADNAWDTSFSQSPSSFPSPSEQPATKSKIDEVKEQNEFRIAALKKERLPIPQEIEGDEPVLPRDISVLSDSQLRRLHSEFHACLARANWLVAIEEADEFAADQLASYYYAKALGEATSRADKGAKLEPLKAEASSDDGVREWRSKANEHHVQVKLLKALRDTYLQTCERVSREYSMRQGERNNGTN